MCLPKALEEAHSWEVEDASLSPPGVERRPLMGKKTCSAGLTLRRAQRTGMIRRGGGGRGARLGLSCGHDVGALGAPASDHGASRGEERIGADDGGIHQGRGRA